MIEPKHMHLRGDYFLSPDSIIFNKVSFYTLLLYFALQPFNEALHRIVLVGSYIDLIWVVVFLTLALFGAKNSKARSVGSFELKIVFTWVVYLVFCFLLTGINQETGFGSATVYNLRFFLQAVPIFIIVVVRGLNRKELNTILITIVLATPFSIFAAYRELELISVMDLKDFANSGAGVFYNTYVPYTTFPLFAAIYLISQVKSKLLLIPIFCSCSLIAVFIFVNPSRQSVIFTILGVLILVLFSKKIKILMLIAIIVAIVTFSIKRLDLMNRVSSRFFSQELFETTRVDQMKNGISTINGPEEWLFGIGLNITLEDGVNPHNSYIFSVMTIGLLGMIMMFLPFLRAIIKLITGFIKYGRRPWFNRNLNVFVMNTMLFVLFHSFFGYPYLDPLNGPIVWFGLAIWVVYHKEIQAKTIANRRASKIGNEFNTNDNMIIREG